VGRKLASDDANLEVNKGKSAKTTADIVGTSQTKVEKARKVLKEATPETKDEINQGKKTINKAYEEIKSDKKKEAEKDLSKVTQALVEAVKVGNKFRTALNELLIVEADVKDNMDAEFIETVSGYTKQVQDWIKFLEENIGVV
jgi:hypothetical protein